MKTQVAILHHDYPTLIREHVESRLRQLAKFYDRAFFIRANLERQNGEHRVELIANVGRGSVLVADVRDETFGVALDEALERMTRQLKKHHDKLTVDRHRGGRSEHVV